MGHHPFTNIVGYDPDITTSDHDFRRIKKIQPWFPFYIAQHIYAPLVYGLLGIKVRISDVKVLMEMKQDKIRLNPIVPYHWAVFIGGKAFFILTRLVVPFLLHGWQKTLIMFAIADLTASYYLALCFQASHVISDVEWIYPAKNSKLVNKDWYELQVVTAQDYAHDNWFITFFTGALNYQICHHVFPGILQIHYPAITPIIKQTCKEFGIRYRHKETIVEAIGDHIGYLKELGNDHKNWKQE